jgi:methyl-accepting chemotaxis protein
VLRFISNLPISRRLFVAFTLAAILPSLVIASMGFYYVFQLNGQGNLSSLSTQSQDNVNMQSQNLQDMYKSTKDLETQVLATNSTGASPTTLQQVSSSDKAKVTANVQNFVQALNLFASQYDLTKANMAAVTNKLNSQSSSNGLAQNEDKVALSLQNSSWPAYEQAQQEELVLLQGIVQSSNGGTITAAQVTQIDGAAANLDSKFANVTNDLESLTNYVIQVSNQINTNNPGNTQVVIGATVVALLINLVILAFSGFAVQRSITGPLTELVTLTKRITKGDTSARAKISSRDEISIVANSMNNMLDNIVHLIQDTQSQRDVLQGQVEKLVSEVSGVGEGDLRVQAEVTADALGVLADSFNYMVEELGSLVVRVKMVAREVEESTTMTSDRMSELVETADRQIKEIAGAATEIERMAQTSQLVAGKAQALASSAREARFSAQGGRQAVQQTVEGMERIRSNVQETSSKVQTLGDRSREINNIVEAISNIAHQTNRLALDAAIQAAMAGDNGKGFGAVAADIRRLAERAKEQASSIGRIVRSVRDDIGAVAVSMRDTERETSAGAKLAEEAGVSLEMIFSVVERQAREIEVINQMVTQQQMSSNEVVQTMQGVSESTQGSSGSTREAAQNMERMARLAEQLLASVEAFKLRENLNYIVPGMNNADAAVNNQENSLTISGVFRTVTSTAQPISNSGLPGNNGNFQKALPAARLGDNFAQYSPLLSPHRLNSGTPQQFGDWDQVPQRSNSGGLSPFPQRSNSGNLPPFPQQGGGTSGIPQWPGSNDWQTSDWDQVPQRSNSGNLPPFPQQGSGTSGTPQWSGSNDWQSSNRDQGPQRSNNGNASQFPQQGHGTPGTSQWPGSNDWQTGKWPQVPQRPNNGNASQFHQPGNGTPGNPQWPTSNDRQSGNWNPPERS